MPDLSTDLGSPAALGSMALKVRIVLEPSRLVSAPYVKDGVATAAMAGRTDDVLGLRRMSMQSLASP